MLHHNKPCRGVAANHRRWIPAMFAGLCVRRRGSAVTAFLLTIRLVPAMMMGVA